MDMKKVETLIFVLLYISIVLLGSAAVVDLSQDKPEPKIVIECQCNNTTNCCSNLVRSYQY